MDPMISINTLCLPEAPFELQVKRVARLGAHAIGPGIEEISAFGVGAAARVLRDTGLSVATLTHRAFAFATPGETVVGRDRLAATIDVAAKIGAKTITMTTGGRGATTWRDAAARFVEAIEPCVRRAADAGVILSLEPTSHLYADVSIAHRLSDTLALAQAAGIGVGIDLFACWSDSDIEDAIAAAGGSIALVQVSDHIAGDRALPCRAVPGDGMIPLDRLVPAIVRTGFRGYWDIEVIGPRLAEAGAEKGLARAAARLAGWIGSSSA